ncbi:FAD-dependent oxidoreductase [Cohnella hashimotonis]|uniref:FAD-dependent oxidoreductase n=1 Tax=Cohnella hashimotonis TaxID=2826895 RepID=A0ABT6TBX2_9BACL|nr:FAD-dependent oxidoreductase [Cohnella hashimotonis]MDI4643825.1 FAD-dependent oxidoreductase [Cohnella hashimotonis]
MRFESIKSDVTVIGGGLSGVCAAVAAARNGKSVALVQNRPVLGGNSSSEIRVWVVGATGHGVNRYARETGIMGEMFLKNQYVNPEGNPYLWDMVVLETVRAEPNIRLFLNTDVHEIEANGPADSREIAAVTGWMMGSERRIRFESPVFMDCTGDGLIGFLAGAKYRIGREARSEYGEKWAPEEADGLTLGSTLLFYTKEAERPVKYIPPSFAKDITKTPIPMKRVLKSGDSGCHYWWIEWGGEIDTLHDNERIRDELWSVIYGIWDYIKNSGNFDAERATLEWVGSVPGKREYRRFIGDYVLTQNDIEAQTTFDDCVTFGGWSIDLHHKEGMYANTNKSMHYQSDGIFQVPYRTMYSVNVNNLLFAGRNISATHIAFGATRVMGTCATIGEAAGTAAALCVEHGVTPRELYRDHLKELQRALLWQDASVIGLKHDGAGDLAARAKATASGHAETIRIESPDEPYRLDSDIGMLVPADPGIEGIEILLDADQATTLEAELWTTGRPENYIPVELVAKASVPVHPGERQWVSIRLPWRPAETQNAFVVIRENAGVRLYLSHKPWSGVLSFVREKSLNAARGLEGLDPNQPTVQWSMRRSVRKPFCMRLLGTTGAYLPSKATDGYLRPYGGPHMWSADAAGGEAWLSLKWEEPIEAGEVHLTFNDDVNEDLINLHHHRTPFEAIPELVKRYRIEIRRDDRWVVVAETDDNRQRKRVHAFAQPLRTDEMRIVCLETNGHSQFEIAAVQIR